MLEDEDNTISTSVKDDEDREDQVVQRVQSPSTLEKRKWIMRVLKRDRYLLVQPLSSSHTRISIASTEYCLYSS